MTSLRTLSVSFESLPSSYAMKANHGYGWNEPIWDASKADVENLRAKALLWLSQNFYCRRRERHYRSIKPKVMFEQLLQHGGRVPNDYKIYCFQKQGQLVQLIQVHSDRFGDHRVNFFTSEWDQIPFSHSYAPAAPEAVPRPENLSEMLALAARLAESFNYVRVDLYSLQSRIYFGELTFTPGAGLMAFYPSAVDADWAQYFDPDTTFYGEIGAARGTGFDHVRISASK
jgi:hypothetical protein